MMVIVVVQTKSVLGGLFISWLFEQQSTTQSALLNLYNNRLDFYFDIDSYVSSRINSLLVTMNMSLQDVVVLTMIRP